jgi:hypothetical protein
MPDGISKLIFSDLALMGEVVVAPAEKDHVVHGVPSAGATSVYVMHVSPS